MLTHGTGGGGGRGLWGCTGPWACERLVSGSPRGLLVLTLSLTTMLSRVCVPEFVYVAFVLCMCPGCVCVAMNSGDLDKDKPSFLPATWAALPTLSAEDLCRLFIAYNLEGVQCRARRCGDPA